MDEPTPEPLLQPASGPSLGRFTLLLTLFVVLSFPDVIFGWRTFFYRDFGIFGYPLAFHHRASFWAGEIPLWNPFNNSGVPFLAQWNTMVFYPLSLCYVLLPLSWSLPVFCLLHLLLGGTGMHCLAFRWTRHRLAASVAGLLFAFSGLMLSSLKWPNNMAALGWMPWVVFLAERAWREGGRWIPAAALAGAMQMLSGGPEIILFTWLITGALWAMQLTGQLLCRPGPSAQSRAAVARPADATLNVQRSTLPLQRSTLDAPRSPLPAPRSPLHARPAAHILSFITVTALVACLAAVQLLPFLQLLAHSQRAAAFNDTSWAMPPWGAANFLVPLFRTFPSYHGVFVQPNQFWIASYYAGTVAVAFAIIACLDFRNTRVRLLLAISLLSLWLSLGEPGVLYSWLRDWLPGFQVIRFPIKFLVPALFSLPLLAAIGLEKSIRSAAAAGDSSEAKRGIRRLLLVTAFLTLCIGAVIVTERVRPMPNETFGLVLRNALLRLAFFLAGIALVWTLMLALARFRSENGARVRTIFNLGAFLLLAVLWFDLHTHAPRLNPTVEPWVYEPGLPKSELKWDPLPEPGASRAMVSAWADYQLNHLALTNAAEDVLYSRFAQFANVNLLDRVPKIDGFFSLSINEESRVRYLLYRSTNAELPQLESFLGVAQKTRPPPGKPIEWMARTNFRPFATAGQVPVYLDGPATLRKMAEPSFNPAEIVLLDPGIEGQSPATHRTNASVRMTHFSAHRITLQVDAVGPAWVVLAQSDYPGWRAYRDGQEIPIRKANHAFQAVEAPGGRSVIEFVYRDRLFATGAGISALTLAGTLAALGLLWRKTGAKH